ncbi:hypothetical protein ACFLU5_18230 [Bacteroidota bacterium]
MKNKKLIWRFCQLGVIILSIITFTPLVIPKNIHLPELFGLPYTLWMGMLLSLCFTSLILIGIRIHPGATKNEQEND